MKIIYNKKEIFKNTFPKQSLPKVSLFLPVDPQIFYAISITSKSLDPFGENGYCTPQIYSSPNHHLTINVHFDPNSHFPLLTPSSKSEFFLCTPSQ